MLRTTFYDFRNSRIPESIGSCASDTPRLLSYCNEATQRLVFAGGDQGWWGGWVKMVFNVITATESYITAPREVARVINMDVCKVPIRMQNEFYEFLEFGEGLKSANCTCSDGGCNTMQAYDRGMYPTARCLTAGKKLRAYATNAADISAQKRLFIQGTDVNDNPIYEVDNGVQVTGTFMTLAAPFVDSAYVFNTLTRVQKDVTLGPVSLYEVDQTTGDETLLSTFAPGETNPAYRRYFIKGLPCQCTGCDAVAGQAQITAMCKLEFVPVTGDTDTLLIGNLPALKEEALSVRYGEMDSEKSQKLSAYHHAKAIRLLNAELQHYLGKEQVAFAVKPFGSGSLSKYGIGWLK